MPYHFNSYSSFIYFYHQKWQLASPKLEVRSLDLRLSEFAAPPPLVSIASHVHKIMYRILGYS